MILAEGKTEGGAFAQLVPDENLDEWVATIEQVSQKVIEWTFTPTTAVDLRSATMLTQINGSG